MSVDPMTDAELKAALAAVSETQLTCADFPDGARVFTIRGLKKIDDPKQKWAIHLQEAKLPWKPGVVMRRIVVELWGKPRADWIGRKIALYLDPEVMFGPDKTGGIRIRAMSHINGVKSGKVPSGQKRKESYHIEPISTDTPKPITVPTWATEGEATLTDEQLGEVVAFLDGRKILAKVEGVEGPRDSWTAATVRTIYTKVLAPAGGSK